MKPLEKIEKIVKKFSVDTNAERNELVLNELLEAQAKSKKTRSALNEPNIWRIIMKNRITKLATAAVIIIAVFIGINQFGGSIDGASVALADILENLQQRGYTFTYWSRQEDGELKEMGSGMVLQPGLIRWDIPEEQWHGLAIVIDAINHKMRWVTTTGKDLGEAQIPKEIQDDPNFYDITQNFMLGTVEELWGLVDGTEQSLGSDTKDGVDVVGYRVERTFEFRGQKGTFIYTIWANASTAMPHEVTIEITDPTGKEEAFDTLLTDFDFDAAIDESLFGLGQSEEPEDVNDDLFIIQPGVGMGMLCFGDDSSKIEEFVGIPEFAQGGVFFVYPGFMVVAQRGEVYKIICGDDKGSNGRYKCPCRTLKGIAIGSTEQAVIQAYGQPNTKLHDSSQYSGATQWLYREKGMTIAIVNNRVYMMGFQKPIKKRR